MRSVERRFNCRQIKNPNWSSWVCFAEAIIGQNFKNETIQVNFNKLVNKNEYAKNEKMQLLKYLYQITKRRHEDRVIKP